MSSVKIQINLSNALFFFISNTVPPRSQTYYLSVGYTYSHLHAILQDVQFGKILIAVFQNHIYLFSSLQFSCSVMYDSLQPHGPQHTRSPCPSPTPGVYLNSSPLSQWCHLTISSSLVPFSFCLQSFPASGSFQMSQFFASGGQSIGVSASTSVLPMNTQVWSPSEWTGWISL